MDIRAQRDRLVRQLRADDPLTWTYPALPAAAGAAAKYAATCSAFSRRMRGGFSILALTFWHIPPSAWGAAPNGADDTARKDNPLSAEENKAIVGRWFTEFWGPDFNPAVIDELAAPNIRFEYSLHAPLRGRDAVRDFAAKFRAAFPDLAFGGTADLIAEGDYVVGQWIGGGTHTGDPMTDLPLGGVAKPNTGKTMRFTGITILKVENGMITEEVGLDDGVSVLRQLGLIAED